MTSSPKIYAYTVQLVLSDDAGSISENDERALLTLFTKVTGGFNVSRNGATLRVIQVTKSH